MTEVDAAEVPGSVVDGGVFAPVGELERVLQRPATALSGLLESGAVSSAELTEACLTRIDRLDPVLHAFVLRLDERARAAAAASDARRARGERRGPLDGLPIAVKDLEPMAGLPFSRGVRALAHDLAPVDALPVQRLEAAGAVIVGKTNLPPFAYRGITDNELVGPTSTPWDPAFNSGGSSGGSAAAVAGGLVTVAEASDGGGSIRIPAAMCGMVGYKPSAGLVADPAPNAFGLVTPYIHVGSVGRTVGDVRAFVDVLAGWDRFDPFSAKSPSGSDGEVRVIGIDRSFGDFPVSDAVAAVFDDAVARLAADGRFAVREVRTALPSHELLTRTWLRQVAVPHAVGLASFGERAARIEQELPDDYLALLQLGRDATAVEYYRDGEVRTAVLAGVEAALDEVDLLITPTLGVDGVPNGEAPGATPGPTEVAGVAVDPGIGWCLTHPVNLSGHPAVTIPVGTSARGLPVGAQLIAGRWDDRRLLDAAARLHALLAPVGRPF